MSDPIYVEDGGDTIDPELDEPRVDFPPRAGPKEKDDGNFLQKFFENLLSIFGLGDDEDDAALATDSEDPSSFEAADGMRR